METQIDLGGLVKLLHGIPEYKALLGDLSAQGSKSLGVLRSARPYLVAGLAQDTQRLLVVICARVDRTYNLAEQLLAWSPSLRILTYAEPNAAFYQHAPWSTNASQARLKVLSHLAASSKMAGTIIVTSARSLMQRTLAMETLTANSIMLERGKALPTQSADTLVRRCTEIGYEAASIVTVPGTFSRRGGIFDVFPIDEAYPIRVELWGDDVESMRVFDPATQRSMQDASNVRLIPAREALPMYGPDVAHQLKDWLEIRRSHPEFAADEFHGRPAEPDLLAAGQSFPELEYYLPWMTGQSYSILDHLTDDALVLVDDWSDLTDTIEDLETHAQNTYRDMEATGDAPPEMPLPLVPWVQLEDDLSRLNVINLASGSSLDTLFGGVFAADKLYGGQIKTMLEDIRTFIRTENDKAIIISRQAARLTELWNERSSGPRCAVTEAVVDIPGSAPVFVLGALTEGWKLSGSNPTVHLLTDAEIFGWQRPEPRRRHEKRAITPESFFADLEPGNIIVHIEYGIGQFQGLEKRVISGSEREYLLVSFAGGDTLFVPIYQAERLSRYVGADDSTPELSRLGTPEWNKVKEKTREAVELVARELLELYAARETTTGHAFSPDGPWQHELEASFPYVETEDQLRALSDVKSDMESPQPMDRLICGDVGYGKTEVALRAAFKAVMDSKQVAMLVPTTVLAQQHFETFTHRLAPFPIKVEMLSRFRTAAEQDKIVASLASGEIDIVIGTHRLLGRDVNMRDLGLLIIDEEQRFGVSHKERFKQMRTEVDVLTLTATPIPRTLYMSLTGVRDISTIDTAPEERQPVVTFVGRREDDIIRQAILRELDRGGQAFYVHNRVQTIYAEADFLSRLVPEARLGIGHGQMSEIALEAVMEQFAAGEIDVLVSTSIIEAGLDIPNANTLIVDRADTFGLSQLHQLRGRVGRSANRAFAFFFHPSTSSLTSDALARLETIGEQTELGAGINIAMRDLEIRGAGDILGTKQHGQIAAVGFHLYTRMLSQAVNKLKSDLVDVVHPVVEQSPELKETVTIDLPFPTFIPSEYIEDTSLRIQLYRRMAELNTEDAIDRMSSEMSDRFGPLPEPVSNLLYQLHVKVTALRAGVEAVTADGGQVKIRLANLGNIDRVKLQQGLGHDVRVSRTGIWLPRLEDSKQNTDNWKLALLEILRRIGNTNL